MEAERVPKAVEEAQGASHRQDVEWVASLPCMARVLNLGRPYLVSVFCIIQVRASVFSNLGNLSRYVQFWCFLFLVFVFFFPLCFALLDGGGTLIWYFLPVDISFQSPLGSMELAMS